MTEKEQKKSKDKFLVELKAFAKTLTGYVSSSDNQWTIKGFIDIFENIYTISNDTKIISKILEIHIFPKFLEFAEKHKYQMIFCDKQNWYPDISFISTKNENIKFALDLKTTYLLEDNPEYCNGFTLGSHGEYFTTRTSRKNIQFPYNEYLGHYCLGILYKRKSNFKIDETQIFPLKQLKKITSVIEDFTFFGCEKWTIASDRSGSGNTANIGSIIKVEDILNGNGVFKNLGEKWFDDYWMNHGKITITNEEGTSKKITTLNEFLKYKGVDTGLSNKISNRIKKK